MHFKKHIAKFLLCISLLFCISLLKAQQGNPKDTANRLPGVTIKGIKNINGVERLPDSRDGIIYSGEKNTVLLTDSLITASTPGETRSVFSRIPGAMIAEAQGSGFPYNGIGFRGFDATQGINVNLRQNGYNITSDIYGHPESYYIPPVEAIDEIDVISGESSLMFGPQFGGVVNYILKDGCTDKPVECTTSQTGGSFGMFNTFNSVGGTLGKWNYYVFGQYQGITGWRPNSQEQEAVGYAKLQYTANANFKIGIEYTIQRNLVHMPGGLDDAEFSANADQSFRPRNWISTPWNIVALTSELKLSEKTLLTFKTALNISARHLIWRNDNASPGAPDSISPVTNSYAVRELELELFRNSTTELRLLTNYHIGHQNQSLAAGMRFYDGWMLADDRGHGSGGIDNDLNLYGSDYGRSLTFTTINVAPFIENTFRIGEKLAITPGFRYEYLTSTVNGYFTNIDTLGTIPSLQVPVTGKFTRYIPLAGIGLQYVIFNSPLSTSNFYANIAQTYNPINYDYLYPAGVDAIIDPNLHDVHGYNSDFGFRGNIKDYLNFDIGGFYVAYNGAIATENVNGFAFETNIGNSTHKGIESYVDWNIIKTFTNNSPIGYVSIYNSFSFDNAKYISGPFSGNLVEAAPQYINRAGLTYSLKKFSASFNVSYVSQSFADANNTISSANSEVGIIPSYIIEDFAASLKIKNFALKAGIDNLADAKYFTMRVTSYPGPGIIPGIGRNFYMGFSATF